jgi:hypothetical protein
MKLCDDMAELRSKFNRLFNKMSSQQLQLDFLEDWADGLELRQPSEAGLVGHTISEDVIDSELGLWQAAQR